MLTVVSRLSGKASFQVSHSVSAASWPDSRSPPGAVISSLLRSARASQPAWSRSFHSVTSRSIRLTLSPSRTVEKFSMYSSTPRT